MANVDFLITLNGKPTKDLFELELNFKEGREVITDKAISTNKQIYFIILQELKKNYDSEGAYFGSKWKKLKPGTVKRKKGNTKILVDKGDLRATVIGDRPRGHKRIISKSSVKVGSTLIVNGYNLASLHHRGNKYLAKRRLYKDDGKYITRGGLEKINRKYESLMGLSKSKMEGR